jgi:hypothetical protein
MVSPLPILPQGHPFHHLTHKQITLFIEFVRTPYRDFVFDISNWKIRSLPGIVEPNEDGTEEWIEFTDPNDYCDLVVSLGATRLTKHQAANSALRLLDMGPEFLNHHFNRIYVPIHCGEVNWKRDGF